MSKSNRNFSRNGSGKHRHGKKNGARYANPQQVLQKSKQAKEKCLSLAREALAAGDPVEAENYFQHADHYTRVINSLNYERHYEESHSGEASESTADAENPYVAQCNPETGKRYSQVNNDITSEYQQDTQQIEAECIIIDA